MMVMIKEKYSLTDLEVHHRISWRFRQVLLLLLLFCLFILFIVSHSFFFFVFLYIVKWVETFLFCIIYDVQCMYKYVYIFSHMLYIDICTHMHLCIVPIHLSHSMYISSSRKNSAHTKIYQMSQYYYLFC